MSFWSRVLDTIRNLASRGIMSPESLQELKSSNRQIAFTIAFISLAAKMAKADGHVTVAEIRAFKSIFRVRKEDERNVAKVFNLAKQTVAGFERYAASVAKLFEHDPRVRADVLEGLFHIAASDKKISPAEEEFLWRVNEIFDLSEDSFERRLYRFTIDEDSNPYKILGVDPSESDEEIRAKWKKLIRKNHPDILIARGAPPKATKLAQSRIADYNRSWDEIKKARGI